MIWVVAGGNWLVWLEAGDWAKPTPTKTKKTFNKMAAFFILQPGVLQIQSYEPAWQGWKKASEKLSSCIYTRVETHKKAAN
jgi:hypothetical protein